MQQLEQVDLFGNPVEVSRDNPVAALQTRDVPAPDFRTPSDNWRDRRDEEPERWDGMS